MTKGLPLDPSNQDCCTQTQPRCRTPKPGLPWHQSNTGKPGDVSHFLNKPKRHDFDRAMG